MRQEELIFKTANLSGFFSNLKDGTAFQIRFKDRVGAGIALATALKFTVKRNKKNEQKILVVGVPRGGVIVADVVAQKMDAELGIIMAKKLSAPDNKENAIGAIVHDGSFYLDDFLVKSLKITAEYLEMEKKERVKELEDRIALYGSMIPFTSQSTTPIYSVLQSHVKERNVILVDDGIASGATLIAAARWLRKQEPKQLTIAAPVAQPQAVDLLKNEADVLEILTTPSNFGSVNQFYQDFESVSDKRVVEILNKRKI